MKKYIIFTAMALFGALLACDDEGGPKGTGTDFETLQSSWYEADGEGSVVIPIRGGSVSASSITFGGSATSGDDFELVGVTEEGIEINILDDADFEPVENIRVMLNTPGNNVHTVTIIDNCEDVENPYWRFFGSEWHAIDYRCGFGVTTGTCDVAYDIHFIQDEVDPTKFWMDDFNHKGFSAYIIIDREAGTVRFPDQSAGGDGVNPEITASEGTFTLDECDDNSDMTIEYTYDGIDWVILLTKP